MEQCSCRFCGKTEVYVKYFLTAHRILRCKNCDFMWLDPQPHPGQLDEVYDTSYFNNKKFFHGNEGCIYGYYDYMAERFTKQESCAPIIRRALSYAGSFDGDRPRFLDVGCGLGFFMDVAQDEGCQVEGVEFNSSAVEAMRQKYVFPVFCGDILNFKTDQLFDVVTMMDVVEHFLRPIEAIKKVNTILRPGGILVLSTMDSDSPVSRLLGTRLEDFRRVSEHLCFFTRKTIAALLAREGFEVICIEYYGHTFQLDFLANRMKNISALLSQTMLFWINIFRLDKVKIRFNPMTKILVYARKRIN